MLKNVLTRLGVATAVLATSFLVSNCQSDIKIDAPAPASSSASARLATGEQYVPGEVLIQFSKGLSVLSRLPILKLIEGTIAETIYTKTMERAGLTDGVLLVRTTKQMEQVLQLLENLPGVDFVEPNFIYTHQATSNDPYYTNGSLWGMYGATTSPANQYGSRAGNAWAANKIGSSSVYVGIIDEGFMTTHPDLSANAWVNPYETVNGQDDDGNGYIDDVNGWDFAANNASVYDGTSDDHGTHVAGTIGAKGGNGIGVAGVCWNVKMISLKFLGASGGSTANAIKAIDYLTDLKVRHGLNIVASNNSWGGGGFSQALQNAITRANNANILFIAAAGNGGSDGVGDNNDATPNYPSNYTNANVIAVASITSTGAKSGFSNYGATTVDIGAPGSGIYSTLPYTGSTPAYGSYSGTSMATPHVTGAAALYKSINPSATAAQVKAAILNAGIATPSLSGKCVTGDRLNVSTF
ncbi:S8 family peptidase [Spirosoma validum]|uniref:S8 family serine peptidase n=1 Tax=Spirosoma validum TaxID=2771355 RepID=A0A927B1B0_9BACT|nr:S8 family peptidase [Spirosoma validum]MBD2753513.1 S8 family serine peptidase [Spirosoma validum]